ncbi:MAG: DUF2933 domain-containing protein [Gemmatimonadota bacterium]
MILALTVIAVGGVYLASQYWGDLANNWIYLAILACPLMHLFMHRGHGGHGSHHESSTNASSAGAAADNGATASLSTHEHPAHVASAAAVTRATFSATAVPTREAQMLEFEVKDMTCAHCVARITKALQAIDPAANVEIDLAAHRVRLAGAFDASSAERAISGAGYTPVAARAA